jgi:hypothetical protein
MEHIKVREMTIESVGGEQFTKAEIEEMYAKYQSQVPKTDDEKRAWLASNYSEYSLNAIIETLKEKQKEKQSSGPETLDSIEDVLSEIAKREAESGGTL